MGWFLIPNPGSRFRRRPDSTSFSERLPDVPTFFCFACVRVDPAPTFVRGGVRPRRFYWLNSADVSDCHTRKAANMRNDSNNDDSEQFQLIYKLYKVIKSQIELELSLVAEVELKVEVELLNRPPNFEQGLRFALELSLGIVRRRFEDCLESIKNDSVNPSPIEKVTLEGLLRLYGDALVAEQEAKTRGRNFGVQIENLICHSTNEKLPTYDTLKCIYGTALISIYANHSRPSLAIERLKRVED